ncbi:MAG: sigma-70 family RNA polymerase sigma factor [Gemmatimonadales bacterium]|nr:sigma-70 family RNA polymerase sigma factor [Gemmatimonadales bacterium]NIN48509.1 sigma-70 family RNA polymerase sigma factor [Gemmatimonadales bacterium]NIP05973.1 sigma-70 family RNA polymerase sigma factor [Gemmatimonadales bacterium]NIQ99925.1 sigma-70 family RNA polymerase sigma factor [Gemmatimonadales bacterium]NIS64384.1 sigma-70 family RNA polymerase sigma factor [Gemmatimonadales bacterium]
MSLGDEMIVARVLAGEVDQYSVLVERYRMEFGRYAVSLCGDADLAADAMQEAFIRTFDKLASCRPTKVRSWFFRILTNQCHNVRNRQRVHVPLEAQMPGPERTDDWLMETEIRQAVDAGLEQLTPEQREAFVLKHVQQYSYAEMAQLLGVSEDALKMRVHRARDALRAYLEPFL